VGRIKGTLSGTVVNTNAELADFPYLLNESPYGDGWLIDVKPSGSESESDFFDISNPDGLKGYESFLEAEIQRIKSMTE
jgi:glycine cleavage system H protein